MLAVALGVEAVLGYPDALFRRIGHPVTWMGALLAALDRALNRERDPPLRRRLLGVLALLVLLLAAAAPAVLATRAVLRVLPSGWAALPLGVLAAALPAQRSLWVHVRAVADGLECRGVAGGRAAVESLAENFSDGVVAPALWCLLLGLPGIVLYKAVNTADSMIGHRTARHEAFGWAAARLDDVANLPASRLAAFWLLLAALLHPGADARGALRAVRRDARRHRSPNAGWPEAAMAGALGLRLAGPRAYGGVVVADAWMGEGPAAADARAVRRALSVYRLACVLQGGAVAGAAAWAW